ncbi:CMRF35-like molecule 1 [Oncorhynchus keta]|uniref:CMRF35-like molecule 1 n=1 Tax=Oncorhynchus keta TaxID=8018 RepID=UPI0015FD1FEC|nr:CMRF35-like molecule 1 [Oncorhynchus keta]
MKFYLMILLYLPVLSCYAKRSKIGEHGHEGGSLDIKCSYPDGYQYKPKYLCRHPCSYSDVLIRSVKADTFVTVGRFSVYDNVHGHTFIATIKNLKLQDSGLYYCGLDQWGRDVLTKVDVSVSKAPLVTSLFTPDRKDTTQTNRYVSSEVPTFTQLPVADWDVAPTSSSILIDSTGFLRVHVVVGAVGLLMCCTVVALCVFFRKRSMPCSLTFPASKVSDPVAIAQGEEDTCHVYDEIIMKSSNILPQEDSDLYCTAHLGEPPLKIDDNALYSLLTLKLQGPQ